MDLKKLLNDYTNQKEEFQKAGLWIAAEKINELIKLLRDYIAVISPESNNAYPPI